VKEIEKVANFLLLRHETISDKPLEANYQKSLHFHQNMKGRRPTRAATKRRHEDEET